MGNCIKKNRKFRKFSLLTVKKEMLKQNTSENLEKDEKYIDEMLDFLSNENIIKFDIFGNLNYIN